MAATVVEGNEPDEIVPIDEPEGEQVETQEQQADGPEDDEFVIEVEGEDEAEPEAETSSIRAIREELKRAKAEAAELRKASAPKAVEVGKEPDLWDDCEGDPDKYKIELSAWFDRKNAADRQTAEQARASQAAQDKVRQRDAAYAANAAQLQVRAKIAPEAYQASEDAVNQEILTGEGGDAVKALILGYVENPALLIHALGSRPQLRARIGAIEDPVKRFLALHDLSKEIKVQPKRKAPPPPEERVSGSGSLAPANHEKKLAELEKKAEKTGDRTEIIAYKKQMKEKSK